MKKIWKWLALGLVIIVVSLTISYKVYSDVKETVEVVYTPFHDELSVKEKKPLM